MISNKKNIYIVHFSQHVLYKPVASRLVVFFGSTPGLASSCFNRKVAGSPQRLKGWICQVWLHLRALRKRHAVICFYYRRHPGLVGTNNPLSGKNAYPKVILYKQKLLLSYFDFNQLNAVFLGPVTLHWWDQLEHNRGPPLNFPKKKYSNKNPPSIFQNIYVNYSSNASSINLAEFSVTW